ncbi:type VI secretion system baseplate subunit TssF [Burkholderia sp. Bp9140]|uniref:type VI secretion system baseplate subunit TssF n=1 Tax=Burkholderia sp. Bp9140 TaxID=2184572 RepID=UPI000F56F72F|nr:type VI secretion system baseplate subunit TssF [Burkholderia sp. Bp9140]RQR46464.1 type VI secretion system baseplate subunit TssF [Burkholderia sp. Bp9140]
MDHLLSHYEHEVGMLVRHLAEFSRRFPKIAARLGIAGAHVEDLHVDRIMQSFALLAARIDAKLDDDYPQFTEALLEVAYPQYLRTIPSCALASFDPAIMFGQLTEPMTIARGTMLDANAAPCRFRTVYDVTLSPLRVHSARYSPATLAPASARIPAEVTGIISISFASEAASQIFDEAIPSGPIRVHLAGDRSLVVALTDALLLRASSAYVEADDSRHWISLSKVPIEAIGFGDDEHLLPDEEPTDSQSFRSLIEYFAYPEKFDFVDIDLGRIRRAARAAGARRLTLHVAVQGTPNDSAAAQILATLGTSAFRLFCTPVVNLFERAATPIQLTSSDAAYPIVPIPLATGVPLSVYSIKGVYLGDRTEWEKDKVPGVAHPTSRIRVLPYRAFSHTQSPEASTVYWVACRDPEAAPSAAFTTPLLTLLNLNGHPANPRHPQVDVDVLATNGELPSRLPIGAPDSDLLYEGSALTCPITLFSRPTLPASLPRGHGALWRVLSALAPHPLDLTRSGLPALKDFLRQHAPRSSVAAQRCIDAIVDLSYKPAIRWMSLDNQFPSFVRGVEILLSFSEAATRNVSLHRFSAIMDPFFGPYAHSNSYIQLVILSAETGKELLRCTPRPGTRSLV